MCVCACAMQLWRSAASAAGDDAVDFLPLVYPTAAVGKKMSSDPKKWHAWEFSLRPFVKWASADIAARTQKILNAPCTCYDTVHGNAPAFNPIARTSASRLRAFRRATLRNLPRPMAVSRADAVADKRSILWVVRRHALRNMANEATLRARFAADASLSSRVRRIVLEGMALSEQMRLLASVTGLLAVHGQAMAWVLLLPSAQRRTTAIEVFPQGLVNPIYRELSVTLGVRYQAMTAPPTTGCKVKLNCNVTVDVDRVVGAVARAVEWADADPNAKG